MIEIMPNQISFIQDILYSLTRQYGVKGQIVRKIIGSTNYETGAKIITTEVIRINRIIRLPDNSSRVSNLDFLVRKFSLPTLPDINKRQFIVNAKDLPKTFTPRLEDIITVNVINYKISKVEQLEDRVGYLIEGEEVP